jgi:glycosyltransferase involved in cell wall biosynthesis
MIPPAASADVLPITVIIPSYNRRDRLTHTLPLYLALPVQEVLLVDDGSSDNTDALLEELACDKLRCVRNPQCLGLTRARNVGIEAATTDIIQMGEDDVLMDEAYLRGCYAKMQELDADFLAGRRIEMKSAEEPADSLARANAPENTKLVLDYVFSFDHSSHQPEPLETPFIHACSMYKRKWALEHPYSPLFVGNALREESDFYLRCAEAGARMYYCSEFVSYHMFHDYSGGCRPNAWRYIRSGIANNRRFLKRRWEALAPRLGLSCPRWRYALAMHWHLIRGTSCLWLTVRFPRFYAGLKKLAGRG